MGKPFASLPAPGARPFIVEVRRGAQVESRHPVVATIVDGDGKALASWGDPQSWIFPRSSNKAIQALPLVESGAADAFSLSQSELSMACASHGGETRHTETAAAWLARIGRSADDLECGAHWPYHDETARQIAVAKPGSYWTDQLNNTDVLPGYARMADEIWQQSAGSIDAFVHSVGTAGSFRGINTDSGCHALASRDRFSGHPARKAARCAALSGLLCRSAEADGPRQR